MTTCLFLSRGAEVVCFPAESLGPSTKAFEVNLLAHIDL
jgi:hypothetical protein